MSMTMIMVRVRRACRAGRKGLGKQREHRDGNGKWMGKRNGHGKGKGIVKHTPG
jgi:hypothetical protein